MNSMSMILKINKFICRRPGVCPIFDFLSRFSYTAVSDSLAHYYSHAGAGLKYSINQYRNNTWGQFTFYPLVMTEQCVH